MPTKIRDALRQARGSSLPRRVGPLWAAEVFALVAGLLQLGVVARQLGPGDYGIAVLIMGVPGLLFTLINPQSEEAVVRYVAELSARGDRQAALAVPRLAYAADAVLGVLGVAIVAGLGTWAESHVVKSEGTAGLMVAYAAALGFSASAATSRAVLGSHERFSMVAGLNTISTAVRLGLVLVLVLRGWGVDGVIYGSIAGLVFDGLASGLAAGRELRRSFGGGWVSARLRALGPSRREILRWMLHTELSTLATVVFKEGDVLVLGYAQGPGQAGLYRFARSCTTPAVAAIAPLQRVLYPQLARLSAARDRPALRLTIRRHCLLIGLPLGAAIILALPLADPGVDVLGGGEFDRAVPAAALLLASSAVSAVFYWVRPAYLSCGLTRPLLWISTGVSAATLAGFLVAAPTSGATGVALVRALIAGLLGSLAFALYFVHRWRRSGVVLLGAPDVGTPGGGLAS